MKSFDELCRPTANADEALRPLLERLRDELHRAPTDLAALRAGIVAVLKLLASPRNRTDANCRAVDFFLTQDEAWDGGKFPQAFGDVLVDMAGALHVTVIALDIATNV